MSCYHPYIAVPDGVWPSGKAKYKLRRSDFSPDIQLELEKNEGAILVPCGHCIGCRLDYSKQWANRLMMELQYHDSAYFCTLTYDDDHVPKSEYVDPETGEVCTSLTLRKRDFQLFMKRLRRAFPNDKIRFFACGEYGSDTFRPHYHAIIFGLHLSDLTVYKRSPQGFVYYNSDSFSDCWSVPRSDPADRLGFAVVADVDWNTCAYTARYVSKKLFGKMKQFYEDHGLEEPFSLMSRKPGLAYQYYLDHPEGMLNDRFVIKNGREVKPPRYFSKLFEIDNPEESAIMKEQRSKVGAAYQKLQLDRTDLSLSDYLQVKEQAKLNQIKALRRNQV